MESIQISPNESIRQHAIRHIKSINTPCTDEYLNSLSDRILCNLVHPYDFKFFMGEFGFPVPKD